MSLTVASSPNAISPKVAVITGASAGVGRAIAHRFARAGWRLGLIARDAEALGEVKREVAELGGSAIVAAADVADPEAVFAAADQIANAFGSIDVWINDAMVTVFAPFWQMTPEEFRRVTAVTYLGQVHGTMAALRHMRPLNRGKIIQIGSALAYRGIPLQSAYCGAKHAIRGFTNSLRTELIHDRSAIQLTIMELPAVNTPQFDWARTRMPYQPRPVAPVVEPEVIANAVFEAVGHHRREYWIGLSTLKVILGNMVLPAFLDRYLAKVAFGGQQTARPVSGDRKDNLEHPVHSLHRTRGRFGNEAKDRAIVTSGPLDRAVPLMIGAVLLFATGMLTGGIGEAFQTGAPSCAASEGSWQTVLKTMPPSASARRRRWSAVITYLNPSEGSPMSNNRNPEEKLPGEKPEGKFHYNPGNMSGKKAGQDKKSSETNDEAPSSDKE